MNKEILDKSKNNLDRKYGDFQKELELMKTKLKLGFN